MTTTLDAWLQDMPPDGEKLEYPLPRYGTKAEARAELAALRAELALQKTRPFQPVVTGDVRRFKANAIVAHILDWCAGANGAVGYKPQSLPAPSLNELAAMDFPREDRVQLAQLIGYSILGFGELSYVSDEDYERAERA